MVACVSKKRDFFVLGYSDIPYVNCTPNHRRVFKSGSVGITGCCFSGDGANAVPHYQKLYSRVNHIWINRKGQPILSAMERPRPGGTTLVIMVASEPGKYECS